MSISGTTVENPATQRKVFLFARKSVWTEAVGRAAAWVSIAVFVCLEPCPAFAGATNRTPDRVVSRFRVGPFFEHRASDAGGSFWAVRPFYSKVYDPVLDTRVTDAVWPLSTFHRDREQAWWRVLLAYGWNDDVRREDAAWAGALFPLYFIGQTRTGEEYRALFPFCGHLPHMLLMDDITFTLFPLYLDYEVNHAERTYYLWPFFSRTADDPDVRRNGVFPFYGRTTRRESSHRYVLWPIWNEAEYTSARNPGTFWMLFPLAGEVDREKERQWLFLPPFFSHAKTDASERWRMPWPFYETVKTPDVKKRSYWPFYGDVTRDDETRWYAVWPLIESFDLVAKKRRTVRSRFFPFYVGERVYRTGRDGVERQTERYLRVWPFFSYSSDENGSDLRILELSLIRYSGGIERNWAPFWTLYERTEHSGEIEHDALWGLLNLHRATGAAKEVDAP